MQLQPLASKEAEAVRLRSQTGLEVAGKDSLSFQIPLVLFFLHQVSQFEHSGHFELAISICGKLPWHSETVYSSHPVSSVSAANLTFQ